MKRALTYLLLTMVYSVYMSAEAETCTHQYGYGLKCRLCGEKQPTTSLAKDGIYQLYSSDDSKMLVGSTATAVAETTNEQPNGFHGVWYITIDTEASTMCLRDAEGGKYLGSDGTLSTDKVTIALTTEKVTINGTDYYLRSADCDAYALEENIYINGGKTVYPTTCQDIAFVVKNLSNMQYLSIANEDLYNEIDKNYNSITEHYQNELNRNTLFKFSSYYNRTFSLSSGAPYLRSILEKEEYGEDDYYHNGLGINADGIFYDIYFYGVLNNEESSWVVRPIIIDYDTELKKAYTDLKAMYDNYKAAGVDVSSLDLDDDAIASYKASVDALTGDNKEAEPEYQNRLSILTSMNGAMYGMCLLSFPGTTMQNQLTGKYLAVNRDDCYSLYGSDTNTGVENQFAIGNGYEEINGILYYNMYSMNDLMLSVSPFPSESDEFYLYGRSDENVYTKQFTSPQYPGCRAIGYDPQYVSPDEYPANPNSFFASFALNKPAADIFLGMNAQGRVCAANYKNAAAWWKLANMTSEQKIKMKSDIINEMITEVKAAYADPTTKDITDLTFINKLQLYSDDKAAYDAEKAAAEELYNQDLDEDNTYYMYRDISQMMDAETFIPDFYACIYHSYQKGTSSTFQRIRHTSDGHYVTYSSPTDGKSYKFGTSPLDLFDANQIVERATIIKSPNGGFVIGARPGTLNYLDPGNEYGGYTISYTSDNTTSIPPVTGYLKSNTPRSTTMRYGHFTPNFILFDETNPMRPQLIHAEQASDDEDVEMKYVDALPSTLQGDKYQLADCYWQMDDNKNLKVKMNTVGSDAWATMYLPFDVALPKDVDGYTAEFEKNEDKTAVNFNLYKSRYYRYVWDNDVRKSLFVVKQYTPVILRAPKGTDEIELIDGLYGIYDDYETFYPRYHGLKESPITYPCDNNDLRGVLQNLPFDDEFYYEKDDIRVLSQKDGVIGFYAPSASTTMLKQNKSYINMEYVKDKLTLDDGSEVKQIYFNLMEEDGRVTRIRAPFAEQSDESTGCYNLMGQKLNAPQEGINIINGKKVLVK